VLKTIRERENGAPRTQEECQRLCHGVTGAVAFTLNMKGNQCTCLEQKGLTRHQEAGAFSGPTVCKKMDGSLQELEDQFAGNLNETTRVPMMEVEACEKSPIVSGFAELEQKHPQWVQTCFRAATKIVTIEFNAFYQRFAKFVDMLSWKAGCGAHHEVQWEESAKSNGFEAVAKKFDGGSFATCNWEREEKMDKGMWIFDETRARGWTGTSRVNMQDQFKMKTQYPMPSWLRDLRNVHQCLKKTAAGEIADPNNGISSAIDEVVDDAAMDESRVRETHTPDPAFEELLRQARGR